MAKEVSVRLHNELEKSDESRALTEKLNLALKQQLDTFKESLDEQKSTHASSSRPSEFLRRVARLSL